MTVVQTCALPISCCPYARNNFALSGTPARTPHRKSLAAFTYESALTSPGAARYVAFFEVPISALAFVVGQF